jgi:hypothetical protein
MDRASVTVTGQTVTLSATPTSVAFAAPSIDPNAFSVTTFTDATGWSELPVVTATLDGAGKAITLQLDGAPPAGTLVRVIARGRGSTPLLGTNRVPLAGHADGPAGSAHDGHDFVHMLTGS